MPLGTATALTLAGDLHSRIYSDRDRDRGDDTTLSPGVTVKEYLSQFEDLPSSPESGLGMTGGL
jgi:hypothetical protein